MTRLLMVSALDLDDIRPTGGWILALEIMLDGIGENIGLTFPIRTGILLRTKHNSLASVHAVNPIYYLIQPFHFLELFGVDVEEILLNRVIIMGTGIWVYPSTCD